MVKDQRRTSCRERSPRGVVAKMLDSCFEVSEFELQSHSYVHFWINTLEKGMKPIISQAVFQIVSLLLFC